MTDWQTKQPTDRPTDEQTGSYRSKTSNYENDNYHQLVHDLTYKYILKTIFFGISSFNLNDIEMNNLNRDETFHVKILAQLIWGFLKEKNVRS